MTWRWLGERTVVLEDLPAESWRVARALEGHPGVVESFPAMESVGLEVDDPEFDPDGIVLGPLPEPDAAALHTIRLQGRGEDLGAVADELGLSEAEVLGLLTEPEYRCVCVGFQPGFPYMAGLLPPLSALPRLAQPRLRVPAGSVAVAAGQCGIYPSATPGGWRLLAITEDPIRVAPGDRVRFVGPN